MRLSLVTKLNTIVFVVVCCLGATLGAIFVHKEIGLLNSELELRVNFEGKLLAMGIAGALEHDDVGTLESSLKAAVLGEDTVYVIVKSPDGEIKAAYWRKNTRSNVTERTFPLAAGSRSRDIQQGELFGTVDPAPQGTQVGTLAIGTDISSLLDKRNALIVKTCILVLLASLSALLLGFLFVRLLLRDSISPLLAGIREIGAGNLAYRINSTQDDELGDIGNAIDGMAHELATSLVTRQELETTIEMRTAELQTSLAEKVQAEMALRTLTEDLEKRIRERTADLETTNRELDSFCYSVSHDLRAPLRHISGFSAILKEDYRESLDDEGRDYLDRIVNSSDYMGKMIDDLLRLSRVSRADMDIVDVDLSESARKIVTMFRESEPDRTVQVEIAEGVVARGDASLLDMVLQNLIGNAWKYSSKTPGARISFGRSREPGGDVFFVKDNGVGFDPAYGDKLFRVFERLHGAEFEGTGIGLATVQRIIQRHGGKVWAESELGNGATFSFTLAAPPVGHDVPPPPG